MDLPEYRFTLTGQTRLLMHADDVEAADRLEAFRKAPQNKGAGKAGDDRSPAWSWKTNLYHDGDHVGIPADVFMACLRAAGSRLKLKGNTTCKALTQTGLNLGEGFLEITIDGKKVPMRAIEKIDGTFPEHMKAVEGLGFKLHVVRRRVGQAKHVRVRPCFFPWELSGTLQVLDGVWTKEMLGQLISVAGHYCGLCDERPGGKTPGTFGRFTGTIEEIK